MAHRWTVSQIGTRQHYGVPRGFAAAGSLRRFYTEAWCHRGRRLLSRGPGPARGLSVRHHPGIPGDRVTSFNARALWDQWRERRTRGRRTNDEQYAEYLHAGAWFASAVAADMSRRSLDPDRDVFLGFNTGSLETLQSLRGRGVVTICDQIDPAEVEDDLVRAEAARWPGWQRIPGAVPPAYWARMRQEWAAADLVLVNSEWSRSALVRQGVPFEKMFVVPVAYEPEQVDPPDRRDHDGSFTVLWIGTVNLRKGIPYLIEAARLLAGNQRVRFVVAGPILISDEAVASAPPNVSFVGRIARDRIEPMYRGADLFVLPTISDGFAGTQVEAMAQGLPVLATPNCGRVVTDGLDGLIVPPADAAALAAAIAGLEADRPRTRDMGRAAVTKSRQFGLHHQTALCEAAVDRFRAVR